MDSEDELSLLSPDWDEEFCDSGVHVGPNQRGNLSTEDGVKGGANPIARLPRVAFADVHGADHDSFSSGKRTCKTLSAGIIKATSSRAGEAAASYLPSISASCHRSKDTVQFDIPSCLKTAQCLTLPYPAHSNIFNASSSSICQSNFRGDASEMSFPQIFIENTSRDQGIELNTLKFHAPVCESNWRIPGSPIPNAQINCCNDGVKGVKDGCQNDVISSNFMGDYRSDQSSGRIMSGPNTQRNTSSKTDVSEDNENTNHPEEGLPPHSKHFHTQHRKSYPKIFPQPCCAIGLHPGFNRDRRLPDYVTIDQCYTGNDDRESSTIRIVANFHTAGQGQDPRHGENRQGQAGQVYGTKRAPSEAPNRKERISLRRGVMMRQMSMNPCNEQDMNLLSEMRFDDGSQQAAEQYQSPTVSNEPWDNNQGANRRLSTCSFARAAVHLPPAPTFATVDSRDEISGTDSGGSMVCNVSSAGSVGGNISSGDDSERWRNSAQGSHGSPAGGKIKLKDLGLSHAGSAMRFRLTFDESADAAANNNIELPFDVAPQSLVTKRPSCICGEPELPPPHDSFPPISEYRDSAEGFQSGSTMNTFSQRNTSADPLLTSSYSPGTGSYPVILTPHSPVPNYENLDTPLDYLGQTPGQQGFPDFQTDPVYGNGSVTRVQTQMDAGQNYLDGGHPKVMICISNSQQSFIPYNCDSPTFDRQQEDDQCQLSDFLSHHNNNKIGHYIKDAPGHYIKDAHGSPYDVSSPVDYSGFASHHHHCHHSDCCGVDLGDGGVPSEELRLLSHLDGRASMLQHQDTVSAPPIQDLYRYHVFFSHCPEDREWVEHMVAHLEAPPFNYTCAYASLQDEADPGTLQQRILCAAMLSERVVLVLSKRYVEETWFSFEKTLKQLTQMSLHNQRIMGVLLEDCDIPESLGELYFLDSSDPDFFLVFTKRLKTSRIPRSSASVSSDLGQTALTPANVTNGKILTFCRLQVKVGWDSYLIPADGPDLDIPPSLSAHGIGMEKTEFGEIVTKVSGIVRGANKLPWLLSAQPLAALLLAGTLWLPAFIAVLVVHVDDDSGIALPVRLAVFLFPLGLVAAGYLIKWRRAYWLTKIVRLLVQNCVDVNQALYFQGRPLFVTAAHVRANVFAIYFVYFDATDCVRSVDLLLFTCMEDDWEKLLKLITFYTRDENYLSRMSISERLTVMMSAPYLVKLVRQVLPHPPQQRHVSRLLCLCQFTEECISRFAHGLDREDVPGLAELFTRHMPGKVSGSAVRRVQEELFHANHGLVP